MRNLAKMSLKLDAKQNRLKILKQNFSAVSRLSKNKSLKLITQSDEMTPDMNQLFLLVFGYDITQKI